MTHAARRRCGARVAPQQGRRAAPHPHVRPGIRGYEGPASLRTVKLPLRRFRGPRCCLCFEEEVLLDEPLRHHELGSALALALAVGPRVATALAAVAAGARLARRRLARRPPRSAAPQRRAAA